MSKLKPATKKKPKPTIAAPLSKPPKKPKATASASSGGRRKKPGKPKPPTPAPKWVGYEGWKEGQAKISRERSKTGRDIGPIPDIADPDRREACRNSLKLFCETYNPEAFSLAWSEDQLRSIGRIEEAVRQGALYAMAEPRGNGKTTRCRMAALWAVSNSLVRYAFLIGSTDPKAEEALDALRMFIRFLPLFSADYPEVSFPIQELEGISNRTAGQTCEGQSTLIKWTGDCIVLPTVSPPENWPKRWPLRSDGMVPTAGRLFSTSGLTGEGIRGSLKTMMTGEQVRPDFVLLDDPQTPESSRSRTQNTIREQLISADVLGMAGPGKSISAVMPCTVIAPGDCIDRLTDRAKHPMWRGERTRMLRTMPKHMTDWDKYFEVYRRCALREPPDFTESNACYVEHRAVLDDGAEASWRARHLPTEVSAIQGAMHIYYRDRRAFQSEYQNDPDPIDLGQIADLSAGDIARKVSGLSRLVVPRMASQITAAIDVQGEILYYAVVAWSPDYSGSVIDYGTFPPQSRSYFAANDARPSLADQFPQHPDETSRIFAGLVALSDKLTSQTYARDGGGDLALSRLLVDAGKWDETVREACRKCRNAAIPLPAKGYGIGAGAAPMANWAAKPGEKRGDHWVMRPDTGSGRGKLLLIDVNHWKSFVARRLLTPEMGSGCLQFFGDKNADHQCIADHCTAEYRVETQGRGRKLEEWKIRPDRPDNHWWDTLVSAAVAASLQGLQWSAAFAAGDSPPQPNPPRRKIKLSDVYKQKHGGM